MVCSQEEYEEFVKKKGSNSSPRPSFQREEIKPQSYAPNTSGVNRVGVEQDRQGKEKTYSQSDIKAAVEEAIRELSSRNVDMKPQAAAPEGGEAKPAVEQFKPTRAKKKK